MSEESSILPFDSAQGKLAPTFAKATVGKQYDMVFDEFLREEIGRYPEKGIPPSPLRGVGMTNGLVRISYLPSAMSCLLLLSTVIVYCYCLLLLHHPPVEAGVLQSSLTK